jgi:hypothetical protein
MKKISLIMGLGFALLSCSEKKDITVEKTNMAGDSLISPMDNKNRITQETAEEKHIREVEAEQIRKEEEINELYESNSLQTGSTPYAEYYGGNSACEDEGCSKIKVTTSNSDVVVTIKKNNDVVRHAYIQAGDSYTFSFPNGTYQAFFYYGKGWNPEKPNKNGEVKGGFISNTEVGKDDPQSLYNNILEYQLVLQQDGNFSTKPSNVEEAL